MMVRLYRRGKKHQRADPVKLAEAVQKVRNRSMSVRTASIRYGIPKSTISDHVTGHCASTMQGPAPVLEKAIEDRLVKWLLHMSRIAFCQTTDTLLDKVKEIVTALNIPNPFTDNRPSAHWYKLFMSRHPELSQRQPQLLSRERAGVTREGLDTWFEECKEYVDGKDPTIWNEPNRIYNCDETSFPIAPKPSHVIAEKGVPNVYARGSNSKQAITALVGGSAAGFYLRPMLVYPGKVFRKDFLTAFFDAIPDGQFGYSKNGWMDSSLFVTWLKEVFEPQLTAMRIRRPVLLFIDGAQVHLSLFASEFCDEHDIILYTLYPNSTHLMQPMDLTLMGPLKKHYKEAVRSWIQDHPDRIYDKFAFPEAFRMTWRKAATIENIAKGFRVAGMYPFDPRIIDNRKLFPSEAFMPDRDMPMIEDVEVEVFENEVEDIRVEDGSLDDIQVEEGRVIGTVTEVNVLAEVHRVDETVRDDVPTLNRPKATVTKPAVTVRTPATTVTRPEAAVAMPETALPRMEGTAKVPTPNVTRPLATVGRTATTVGRTATTVGRPVEMVQQPTQNVMRPAPSRPVFEPPRRASLFETPRPSTSSTTVTTARKVFIPPPTVGVHRPVSPRTFESLRIPQTIVKGGKRYGLYELSSLQPRTQNEKLSEILKVPTSNKKIKRTSGGARVSGLPRCVSDQSFRDVIHEREDKKNKAEEEKENRKKAREDAKKAKEEEKKRKEEEKKEKQMEKERIAQEKREEEALESLRKSFRKRRPVRRYESSSSSSGEDIENLLEDTDEDEDEREADSAEEVEVVEDSDNETVSSQESLEYYEGSTSWCAGCKKKFAGSADKAIGCEEQYCGRWFHRKCTGLNLVGKSEGQIRRMPFKCHFC